MHHLLSRLETNYFYWLDWSPIVSDIREQYPLLPLEETLTIADQLGIEHPKEPRTKNPVVMTTDFLVTVTQSGNQSTRKVEQARTCKYAKDLQSSRTLSKFEIERQYWKRRKVDWGIVTEREISKTVTENIKWLHPYHQITDLEPLHQADILRIERVLLPDIAQALDSLANIAAACDDRLGLDLGCSLSVVRYLLANRRWHVDMHKRLVPNKPLRLLVEPVIEKQDMGAVG